MKLLRKLFLTKEIISKEGVLHFRRWRLISTKYFSVYIHEIFKADEDKHLHDHPWNYISITLTGKFGEFSRESIDPLSLKYNILSSSSIVTRKATTFHKIQILLSNKVTTLFITGKKHRDWGYVVNNKWIQHEEYRKLKNSGTLNK